MQFYRRFLKVTDKNLLQKQNFEHNLLRFIKNIFLNVIYV